MLPRKRRNRESGAKCHGEGEGERRYVHRLLTDLHPPLAQGREEDGGGNGKFE